MKEFLEQIIYNIVGGALVAILTWVYFEIRGEYYKKNFKEIFGKDASNNFYVVYGTMNIRGDLFEKDGAPVKFPFYKPGDTKNIFTALLATTSFSQAKSANYITGVFGKIAGAAPQLKSDYEIRERLDISFCSVGGLNNYKTKDLLDSDENNFFDFDETFGIIVKEDKNKRFCIQNNAYDYGFIIKVIPKEFPNRVWIAIAGIGEWGTSGASWYLSKNWNKLPKNKPFGLIIRTKAGQDESAKMVFSI